MTTHVTMTMSMLMTIVVTMVLTIVVTMSILMSVAVTMVLTMIMTMVLTMSRSILRELEEPVYSKLYGAEWEDSDTVTNILPATLADYFSDLSSWLTKCYFKKLIFVIMFSSMERHLMFVRKLSRDGYMFSNELTIGIVE